MPKPQGDKILPSLSDTGSEMSRGRRHLNRSGLCLVSFCLVRAVVVACLFTLTLLLYNGALLEYIDWLNNIVQDDTFHQEVVVPLVRICVIASLYCVIRMLVDVFGCICVAVKEQISLVVFICMDKLLSLLTLVLLASSMTLLIDSRMDPVPAHLTEQLVEGLAYKLGRSSPSAVTALVEQLQTNVGCCGLMRADDWRNANFMVPSWVEEDLRIDVDQSWLRECVQERNQLCLVPPSCCKNPDEVECNKATKSVSDIGGASGLVGNLTVAEWQEMMAGANLEDRTLIYEHGCLYVIERMVNIVAFVVVAVGLLLLCLDFAVSLSSYAFCAQIDANKTIIRRPKMLS